MAEELDLTKKVGPLPLWGWGLGVAAVGFFLISRRNAAAAAASGSGGGAAGGQFSTSTTTTNPATGSTTTYQASGPNSSITSPAQLSYGAGPMGYSDGDVYVNYPAQTTAPGPPTPPPPTPPPPSDDDDDRGHRGRPPMPPPPRNPDWGKWETVTNGDTIQALTSRVLGSGDMWQKVWNDPVNQAVRSLRGDPSRLQPGDVVWVFNGWAPGWTPPADFVPYNADASHPSPAGPVVTPPPPDPSQN